MRYPFLIRKEKNVHKYNHGQQNLRYKQVCYQGNKRMERKIHEELVNIYGGESNATEVSLAGQGPTFENSMNSD